MKITLPTILSKGHNLKAVGRLLNNKATTFADIKQIPNALSRRIRSFLSYSTDERKLIARAWVILFAVQLLLWTVPYRHVHRKFVKKSEGQDHPVSKSVLRSIRNAVLVAAKYIPYSKCLSQAICLAALLAKHNISYTFFVGVMKNKSGKLSAHAWIEVNGWVIIGDLPDLHQFQPFPDLDRHLA